MVTDSVRESERAVKYEKIALFGCILAVFCIQVLHCGKLKVPVVFDDEFGYLANAAFFAGFDWSGIVSGVPYYSYGYSILLAPLFRLFREPTHIYQAVVIVNGILAAGSFWLCYSVAKKLARDRSVYVLLGVSFLVAMYPANLVYVNLAMSETLLIFLAWALIRCVISIMDTRSSYPFALFGLLLMYMYMVHQRTVGVVVVGVLLIGVLKATGKISWKQVWTFSFALLLLFGIHWQLKEYLQSHLWQGSTRIVRNDYESQLRKLNIFLSWEGIRDILKMSVGQIFYIGVATCLMGYVALYECVCSIVRCVGRRNLEQEEEYNTVYVSAFLLLSVMAILIIGSVFLSPPHRVDHLLYGRYLEMCMGPLLLIGILRCTSADTMSRKEIGGILLLFVMAAGLVNSFLHSYGLIKCNPICIVGLLVKPLKENGYDIRSVSVFAVLAALFLYISSAAYHNSRSVLYQKIAPYLVAFLFMGGGFLLCGESQAGITLVSWNEKNQRYQEIADYIQDSGEELPVYYLGDEIHKDTKYAADSYQYLLKDKKMEWTNRLDLMENKEDAYVISGDISFALRLLGQYRFLMAVNDSYLLRTGGTGDMAIEIPMDQFDAAYKRGEEQVVLEGPYIHVDVGQYSFLLDLELRHAADEIPAYIEVFSYETGAVLAKEPIPKEEFGQSKYLTKRVTFKTDKDLTNLALRVVAGQATQMEIKKVSIQKAD